MTTGGDYWVTGDRYPVARAPRDDCHARIAARVPRTEHPVRASGVEAQRLDALLELTPRRTIEVQSFLNDLAVSAHTRTTHHVPRWFDRTVPFPLICDGRYGMRRGSTSSQPRSGRQQ